MFRSPGRRADTRAAGWELARIEAPQTLWYRELFRRVGEPYLWSSRLTLGNEELRAILDDPRYEVFAFRGGERDEGLVELDFRRSGECELVFFGVTSAFVGSGAGRWLMNRTLERTWSKPIGRFWVHTCDLDHPAALAFYERSGFRPYKRQVEIFDDPRATGVFPPTAALDVPLI
jgi:GNAT superfamily N-acetyltransferase